MQYMCEQETEDKASNSLCKHSKIVSRLHMHVDLHWFQIRKSGIFLCSQRSSFLTWNDVCVRVNKFYGFFINSSHTYELYVALMLWYCFGECRRFGLKGVNLLQFITRCYRMSERKKMHTKLFSKRQVT